MIKHARVNYTTFTINNPFTMAIGTSHVASGWICLWEFNTANTTLLLQSFLSREISCGDVRFLCHATKSFHRTMFATFIDQQKLLVPTELVQTKCQLQVSIYKEKMPIFMEKKYQTSLKLPRCQWRTSAREKQRSQNSGLASKLLSGGRTSHSMHWNRRLGGSVVKDELQLEQRMQAQSGEKQHSAPPWVYIYCKLGKKSVFDLRMKPETHDHVIMSN